MASWKNKSFHERNAGEQSRTATSTHPWISCYHDPEALAWGHCQVISHNYLVFATGYKLFMEQDLMPGESNGCSCTVDLTSGTIIYDLKSLELLT